MSEISMAAPPGCIAVRLKLGLSEVLARFTHVLHPPAARVVGPAISACRANAAAAEWATVGRAPTGARSGLLGVAAYQRGEPRYARRRLRLR